MSGSLADAEDLAQETFIHAYSTWMGFGPRRASRRGSTESP